MLKGIIDKLFKATLAEKNSDIKTISQEEIEALVDAKVKEHTANIQTTLREQTSPTNKETTEDYTLTPKQVEYALSLIEKVKHEFELTIDPSELTIKDLNRLIAYQRYKNKGTLVNLVKKGVLRKK
ncbi:ABC transporter ATP-binding protein [Mesobacillus maritimus]|uniref:ABC transporter ATP-binding protein n=1 Tax=Mesobacillus maritimus TaxID=1643336 RepID=UPI00203E38E5|nr:ABC transporter ATP-binding protein [Mesobacillus maritimus]MCM3671086.1 ABC transporter ATP-binding protein [Mesobacillus maritimus]